MIADHLVDAVPQNQNLLERPAAEVQITVLKTEIFVGQFLVRELGHAERKGGDMD